MCECYLTMLLALRVTKQIHTLHGLLRTLLMFYRYDMITNVTML